MRAVVALLAGLALVLNLTVRLAPQAPAWLAIDQALCSSHGDARSHRSENPKPSQQTQTECEACCAQAGSAPPSMVALTQRPVFAPRDALVERSSRVGDTHERWAQAQPRAPPHA
jgi:hypothetical protein